MRVLPSRLWMKRLEAPDRRGIRPETDSVSWRRWECCDRIRPIFRCPHVRAPARCRSSAIALDLMVARIGLLARRLRPPTFASLRRAFCRHEHGISPPTRCGLADGSQRRMSPVARVDEVRGTSPADLRPLITERRGASARRVSALRRLLARTMTITNSRLDVDRNDAPIIRMRGGSRCTNVS
jgi:hypothetical protein